MSKKGLISQLRDGLIFDNPVLIQLLGMCPTLATTTGVENAFGMGLAASAVLICSNVVIAILRKIIPGKVRIAAFIVIIAGFVTCVDLLLKAYFQSLSASLGLFIPLIVVNCIILGRAEAFASKNSVVDSAIDGVAMGIGFTVALVLLATIREILGAGSFFGVQLFGDSFKPATLLTQPVGGFLCLGFLIAAAQALIAKLKKKEVA